MLLLEVGRSKRALSHETFIRNTRQSYFIVETDRPKLQGGRCALVLRYFFYFFSLYVKNITAIVTRQRQDDDLRID